MTTHTHPLRVVGTWVMLAITFLMGSRATAQDKSMLARADFGWNTTITAGRWCPVRVWLDGSVAPESVAGIIEISYSQDRTQNASIVVPASTTPGKLTPFDMAVCLPFDVGTVRVDFRTAKKSYSMEFVPPPTAGQTAPPTRGEQRLGQLFAGTRGLIAHRGIASIDRALSKPREVDRAPSVGNQIVTTYMAMTGEQLAEFRWRQLAATDVALDDLPPIPQAYQGLEALVIDPGKSAGIEPRVRAAILDWVASGGRLVLLATDDSGAWRQWITPRLGESITAGIPGRLPPPEEAQAVLRNQTLKVTLSTPPGNAYPAYPGYTPPTEVTFTPETPPVVPVRSEIVGRLFTLSEQALADGWRASWTVSPASGLIVQGPMGMGMVTILGVDPEAIPDTLDAAASQRLWRAALTPSVSTYLETPFSNSHARDLQVTTALNSIVSVPPLGNTVFNVILFSLIALALLLGPIDWFVLKRFRARQHSWLVALGWISIASVAGYVIPPQLRSGPPQINRMTCVDVVQTSNELTSRAAAWQDGLAGLFASGPLTVEMDESPESHVAGSWWHGIAPEEQSYYGPFVNPRRNSLNIFGPLVTPQVTSVARERQSVPVGFSMPSWSYRTLADSSAPAPPPLRATVERDGSRFKVRMSGLPGAEQIARLTLFTSVLAATPASEVEFTGERGEAIVPSGRLPEVQTSSYSYDYDRFGSQITRDLSKSTFFWTSELPGPANRSSAVLARLGSGRWAMIEIVMTAPVPSSRFLPQDYLANEKFVSTDLTTVRLLVPLGPSDATPAVEPPAPTESKEPTP